MTFTPCYLWRLDFTSHEGSEKVNMGSWRNGDRSSVRHDLASEADDVTCIVFLFFFLYYFALLLLFDLFLPFALPSHHAQHACSFQISPVSLCCEHGAEAVHSDQTFPFTRSCPSSESSCMFSPSLASSEGPSTPATTTFTSSSTVVLAKTAQLWL